jgi:hypothetical protein
MAHLHRDLQAAAHGSGAGEFEAGLPDTQQMSVGESKVGRLAREDQRRRIGIVMQFAGPSEQAEYLPWAPESIPHAFERRLGSKTFHF